MEGFRKMKMKASEYYNDYLVNIIHSTNYNDKVKLAKFLIKHKFVKTRYKNKSLETNQYKITKKGQQIQALLNNLVCLELRNWWIEK